MDPEFLTVLDYVMLIMAVVSVLIWIIWSFRNKKFSLYAVAPLSWSINVIIFYFTLSIQSVETHIIWQSIISLHAAFLLLGISFIMLFERIIIK